MIINHNIAALNTYRQLTTNNTAGQKALEKLSSGLRINRAGDDAAGLAISEKMRAQIRGLDQATRNAQDGISMIQTAEGALNETHSILQRMRELATQAANDTNVNVDRDEIQKEINQLTSEINRIGNTTEFNTQQLLKGTITPVTETDAAVTTITNGVVGTATGNIENFKIEQNSVVGATSRVEVQASTSHATGEVSEITVNHESVKGVKASVTLTNGITFEAATTDANAYNTLNGFEVEIVQAIGSGQTNGLASDYANKKFTFTIGTDAAGNSLASNRGELYNILKDELDKFDWTASGGAVDNRFIVKIPAGSEAEVVNVEGSASFGGGVAEEAGDYQFSIETAFKEAGDTITIEGKTFRAVIGAADADKREFSIGTSADSISDANAQAASLLLALQADEDLAARFTITNPTAPSANIQLVEKSGQAAGTQLDNPVVAGAGANDKLIIENAGGQNLNKLTIVQASDVLAAAAKTTALDTDFVITAGQNNYELNGIKVMFAADVTEGVGANNGAITFDEDSFTFTVTGDFASSAAFQTAFNTALGEAGFKTTVTAAGGTDLGNLAGLSTTFSGGTDGVTDNALKVAVAGNGDITIYLAGDEAKKNTQTKIQAAIDDLAANYDKYTGGVDLSKLKVTTTGDWDTATLANSLTKASSAFVGGVAEKFGEYSFEVTEAFSAGDIVEFNGVKFKAVASGADAAKGEFNVAGGNINSQAAGLADAISLSSQFSNYAVSVQGFKVTLEERVATGTDVKAADIAVKATGIQGEFTAQFTEIINSGGAFEIDGEKIVVSNREAHVGYGDGTAIKENSDLKAQTQALADAVNKNAVLKEKYTASVNADGNLILKQVEGAESVNAPVVKTISSNEGNFEASFQVGANSGQSMTITIEDMRSAALGVSGDGNYTTVQAKNGKVASYVEVANVTDGTTNVNVEYALDVSTHDKASAAISVINDAIEAVSAQRSQLGAFQNRLEHTINNLGTSSENLTAAESRIRDVDMAKEMMEFTKLNILSQAAQAMLAQANQQPQGVLQLLR
jgi:flagellin